MPSRPLVSSLLLLATVLLGLGDLLDLLGRLGLHTYTSGTASDFLWYGVQISVAFAASLLAPFEGPHRERPFWLALEVGGEAQLQR